MFGYRPMVLAIVGRHHHIVGSVLPRRPYLLAAAVAVHRPRLDARRSRLTLSSLLKIAFSRNDPACHANKEL